MSKDEKEDFDHGWISLHRKVQDNWLYPKNRPFTQFEAWIDLLLNANHSEKEVNIKNEIFTCKRGQQLRSMKTLSLKWNWDKSKVRRFLMLLESCTMIVSEPDPKTTRITICKYDEYQAVRNAFEPHLKHKRNAFETHLNPNNNVNNVNNDNNENNPNGLPSKILNLYFEVDSKSVNTDHDKNLRAAGDLLKLFESKTPGLGPDDMLTAMRQFFEKCINISDDYLHDKASLPFIVKEFNRYNKKMMQPQKPDTSPDLSKVDKGNYLNEQ